MHRELACAGFVALIFAVPVRADLHSATVAYRNGEHAKAFEEFRALAELGHPTAQFNLAVMYANGEGVRKSMTFGYAWAAIAADNGQEKARAVADELRPLLTPGSIRIADDMKREFGREALEARLMPRKETMLDPASGEPCVRDKLPPRSYPALALRDGVQGHVYVEFSVMPDGTTRHPRVLLSMPPKIFDDYVRGHVMRTTYFPARQGETRAPCRQTQFYRFQIEGASAENYPDLERFVRNVRTEADGGNAQSQMLYGMLLAGLPQLGGTREEALPWFLKAAQAGAPLAQYQVGYSMLLGWGCQCEENKGLVWLRKAAEADQADAQVTLASYALRDELTHENVKRARTWLERAVRQDNREAKVYLSALLAAAPFEDQRDPARARALITEIFRNVDDDPVAFEIRAAAAAASGDFEAAIKDQTRAIAMAKKLRWDPAPLDERLAHYQAGKAWHGDLLGLAATAQPL